MRPPLREIHTAIAVAALLGVMCLGHLPGGSFAIAQQLDPGLQFRMQRVLDSMRSAHRIPGISAAILTPGYEMWQGTAGGSRPGIPVTREMLFGIGSNSKLFTAVAVLKCRENGWLRLDDSLKTWLAPRRNIDSDITIRQLLNHTSGLADVNGIPGYADTILADPNRVFTHDEVLGWIGPPHFAPGTSWEYCNTNYLLAGMIVEKASGQPFAAFLRDSILTHLRLDSTFLPVEDTLRGIIAEPWSNGANISSTPRMSLHSTAWCAGAMYSTASEMTQWYACLFGGRVLHPESFRDMTTFVGTGAYGFGIAEKRVAGRLVWLHGGSIRGYSSQMMFDTAMHAVICVLTNETPAPAALIAQELLEALAVSGVSSIESSQDRGAHFDVYPNPASDVITLGDVRDPVRICNSLGQCVWSGDVGDRRTIAVATLPAGIYFVQSGRHSRLFVKR